MKPPTATEGASSTAVRVDLRGIPCPLNWARARVRLEGAPPGRVFDFLVDDPRSPSDVPRAAEACGFDVLAVEPAGDGAWTIRIQR